MIKRMLTPPLVALMGIAIAGCGGSQRVATSTDKANSQSPAAQAKPHNSDIGADYDSVPGHYYDSDDEAVYLGHAANAKDRGQITEVVRRYYAAAATEDGAVACSLIYSVVEETVGEDYGPVAGSEGPSGNSCSAVLSRLFRRLHSQMAAKASVKVQSVRVVGVQAWALLTFPTLHEGEIELHREGSTWRLFSALDRHLS